MKDFAVPLETHIVRSQKIPLEVPTTWNEGLRLSMINAQSIWGSAKLRVTVPWLIAATKCGCGEGSYRWMYCGCILPSSKFRPSPIFHLLLANGDWPPGQIFPILVP